jgi:NADH-quinone oxidoreductase subunit J
MRPIVAAVAGLSALSLGAGGAWAQGPAAPVAGALGNSAFAALMFWLFAILSVVGSVFVITRRNLVSAVMGMVATFFAIAVIYAMLYAHFIAVIQVLVYAGAIMVLFVFVVMILNREEEEPWALQGLIGKGAAGVALLYLLVRVCSVLWKIRDTAPAKLSAGDASGELAWGGLRALGVNLFGDYLFPFEAVSIVLLIAVVGALAVARPHAPDSARKPEAHQP